MKSISEEGLALIRQFEGFAPATYFCPGGKATIGFGHVVEKGESFPHGVTRDEAELLLRRDVAIAENAVNRLIDVALTQPQFDALVSFTFNIGAAALARSTLRKCLNQEEFDLAKREIMRWVHTNDQISAGLVRRRTAEAALFDSKKIDVNQ